MHRKLKTLDIYHLMTLAFFSLFIIMIDKYLFQFKLLIRFSKVIVHSFPYIVIPELFH